MGIQSVLSGVSFFHDEGCAHECVQWAGEILSKLLISAVVVKELSWHPILLI